MHFDTRTGMTSRGLRARWLRWEIGLLLGAFAVMPAFDSGGVSAASTEMARRRNTAGADAYYRFSMAKLAQQRQDFGAAVAFLKDAARSDPTSAVIQAELAETYLRVRDYPAAEQAAKAAIEIDASSGQAHRVLAQLYYSRARRGMDPDENKRRAMEELEASLGGDEPDDANTLLTLGRFYYESGEYQHATEALRRFAEVQANPSPSALFLLARSLMQTELYSEAEQVLRRIAGAAPDWLQVLEMLARVTRLQGDFEASIEPLERILSIQGGDAATYNQLGDAYFRTGRFEPAVDMFELAGREDPRSPYSLYYLGLSQERLGQLAAARKSFTRLLEFDPANAEVLFRLARLDERGGDTRSAIAHYRLLLAALESIEDESDPRRRDIETFCGRVGVLFMEVERYADAVTHVSKCLEDVKDPDASLHLLLVRALLFDEKGDRALSSARRAARLFPDERRFLTLEAEVMLQTGKEKQAEDRLAELLGADADHPEAEGGTDDDESVTMSTLVSAAYFNAGALAERKGDVERAETLLGKAIEVHPHNGPALNYLGYLWADAGRNLDAAVGLLERAIALEPESGAYLDSLGWAYFRLGRNDEARVQLEKAIERTGADANIHDHLGDVEAAAGNTRAAVEHWRRAMEFTRGGDADAIQEKIRQLRESE